MSTVGYSAKFRDGRLLWCNSISERKHKAGFQAESEAAKTLRTRVKWFPRLWGVSDSLLCALITAAGACVLHFLLGGCDEFNPTPAPALFAWILILVDISWKLPCFTAVWSLYLRWCKRDEGGSKAHVPDPSSTSQPTCSLESRRRFQESNSSCLGEEKYLCPVVCLF